MTETPGPDKAVGARIGAAMIDIAILAVVFVVMAIGLGDSSARSDDRGSSFNLQLTGWPFVLYLALLLGYYWLLEATRGQTLGKMIVGLRVVRVDGSRIGFGRAAVRTLLRVIDWLPAFYLVGLVTVAVSGRNQRLGDLAADTAVVRD